MNNSEISLERQLAQNPVCKPVVWSAALLLGLLTNGSAWSQEESPWALGASQAFRYDSNVFRTPNGTPARSDVESITGVDGRLRAQLGRQEIYLSGELSAHRYRENSGLDNVGNRIETGINWATIERLSGTLRHAQNRSLAAFGAAGEPLITERAVERTQLTEATVRYGLTARSALQAGWAHRRVDYSIAEYDNREYRQNVTSLGYQYGLERALTLGIGGRYTEGRTPRYDEPAPGTFVADRSKRRDVDLTATWVPSALSTISARISATREEHSQADEADFSGTTGSLSWEYLPSGRLSLNAQIARDTGAESRFASFTGQDPELNVESQRILTSAQLGARYELTGKTRLNARYRYARGKLSNTSGDTGHDVTQLYGLGVEYEPLRTLRLACEAGQERRSTNSPLSFAYRATVALCSARLAID